LTTVVPPTNTFEAQGGNARAHVPSGRLRLAEQRIDAD
jgi:hypothetical protein